MSSEKDGYTSFHFVRAFIWPDLTRDWRTSWARVLGQYRRSICSLSHTHPERLSRLTLLAGLLDLCTSHLLLKLSLPHAAVVLEREKDVKSGRLLQLRVAPSLFGLKHKLMLLTPTCSDVDIEAFEQRNNFGDAARTSGTPEWQRPSMRADSKVSRMSVRLRLRTGGG